MPSKKRCEYPRISRITRTICNWRPLRPKPTLTFLAETNKSLHCLAHICIFVASALAISCNSALGDEPLSGSGPEPACDDLTRRTLTGIEEHVWAPLKQFRSLERECGHLATYRQMRAQLESFTGNHTQALEHWDRNHRRRIEEAEEADPAQSAVPEIHAANAIAYILERSSHHQMIMVNERHHTSRDRLLTLSLLEPLYRQGFRYLAVEAVWPGDDINERGYPTRNSGYYVRDVVFADMLRHALALGYDIVGYEIQESQKNTTDSRSAQARRDYWQARNLLDGTLAKDPEARVLVHCGWAHLQEQVTSSWEPMAHFVREMAGIDPLTVDQTRLAERSEPGLEHVLRVEAERQGLTGADPVVLLTGGGEPMQIGAGVDLHVLSPRTRFVNGRPGWMEMSGRRRAVTVAVPECRETACIVEARNAERAFEIAYDRIEVVGTDSVVLYLPSEAAIELFLFDLEGNVIGGRPVG